MALKNIPQSAFAQDDGSAPPELTRALADWSRDPAAEARLLDVLCRSRLLVPVVAVLGEAETGPDGLRREKSSDMAVLTLTLPAPSSATGGERRALPVFTSIDALTQWRPDARPVAVTAVQAIQSAVQEGAATLLVDIAGPVSYQVTGRGLRYLATGGAPARSPEVAAALRALLRDQPAVRAAQLVPGGETDGTLALMLDPDVPGSDVAGPAAVRALAQALAADQVLRSHLVRGLQLAVLPPDGALPGDPLYIRAAQAPARVSPAPGR